MTIPSSREKEISANGADGDIEGEKGADLCLRVDRLRDLRLLLPSQLGNLSEGPDLQVDLLSHEIHGISSLVILHAVSS